MGSDKYRRRIIIIDNIVAYYCFYITLTSSCAERKIRENRKKNETKEIAEIVSRSTHITFVGLRNVRKKTGRKDTIIRAKSHEINYRVEKFMRRENATHNAISVKKKKEYSS